MRLTFILPSLEGGGGAERAVVWLAGGLQRRGHEITVITLSDKTGDFHELPPGMRRVALGIRGESATPMSGLWRNLKRLKVLREAVLADAPDAVIPHINQTNVLTIFALPGAGLPVIAVEHSGTLLKSPGRVWRALRRVIYPRAARVVCVSQGAADYFDWLPDSRKQVIYNPLIAPPETPLPELPGVDANRRWLVAMGRLLHVKGFDLLLAAWAQLAPRYADWQLVVMGAGPLRGELERLRDSLELTDSVVFTGLVAAPFAVLRRAELFAMPSRAEGLPYALLEAMACGCPAVAFDCPDGPREIIRHGVDGLLVENGQVNALAEALDGLLANEAERRRLAANAPEVLQRFGLERALDKWERLFTEIVKGHNAK
jgi:glycosyltransferase involved in cell wall biosynthesis